MFDVAGGKGDSLGAGWRGASHSLEEWKEALRWFFRESRRTDGTVQSSKFGKEESNGLSLDGVLSLTPSGFDAFRADGKLMGGRVLVRHSKAVEGLRPQPHSKTLARDTGSPMRSQRRFGLLRCREFLRPFFTSHLLPAPLTSERGEVRGKRSGVNDEAAGEVRSDDVPGAADGWCDSGRDGVGWRRYWLLGRVIRLTPEATGGGARTACPRVVLGRIARAGRPRSDVWDFGKVGAMVEGVPAGMRHAPMPSAFIRVNSCPSVVSPLITRGRPCPG
jgi:hypothetical protein